SSIDDVTISAYPVGEGTKQTLEVVTEKTFENVSVPLDGYVYDRCMFVNVCLVYAGGAYQLQHASFKEHWSVCTKEPPLKNLGDLQAALSLFRPNVKRTHKSIVTDFKQPQ